MVSSAQNMTKTKAEGNTESTHQIYTMFAELAPATLNFGLSSLITFVTDNIPHSFFLCWIFYLSGFQKDP